MSLQLFANLSSSHIQEPQNPQTECFWYFNLSYFQSKTENSICWNLFKCL